MKLKICSCGHSQAYHQHYTRSTHCAVCTCRKFRRAHLRGYLNDLFTR